MNKNKQSTTDFQDPYFNSPKEGRTITFDVVLWLFRILKHWYLFVIAIIICFAVANLKNRSWVPSYSASALIMLENRGSSGIVGAIPMGTILRNDANQQILLKSKGMTERTVKRLPSRMFVDYFESDQFRTINLYSTTPIRVNQIVLGKDAYKHTYTLRPIDDMSCELSYPISEEEESTMVVRYGERYVHELFTIELEKTDKFSSSFKDFNFRFLTAGNVAALFNGRVNTSLQTASSALTLKMYGREPERDVDFLYALLDEFEAYNLFLKNQQADLTIGFLSNQITIINDSLETARVSLDNFQKKTGVYEISSPTIRVDIDKADEDKEALAIKEKTLLIVSQKIGEEIMEGVPMVIPSELGSDDALLNSLVGQYNGIIEKSKYLGVKNPLYNRTIDEINEIRNQILKELHNAQIKLQEDKDQLVAKYKLLDLKTDNLPPQERDLIRYQREYRVNEVYHQFLTQRKYEAQIQRASNTPDNFVWEPPRVDGGANNSGETGSTYMYWLTIALIVPLVFIVLKEEIFNYTISTKEECEKLSGGLPVIGTVENISQKLKSGPVLVKNFPKSSFAEAFRNIRVRLGYMARKQDKISVLVTSAEPADGKTFIATNVASVFKLMDKKVVIVDLDLRRPSVAKTLNIDSQDNGVSNFLIGQVKLEDIIYKHPDYDFDVIPAGTLPPNPSELIKTEETAELIQTLKEMYDYVIIDCSPVGLVSDAYILAKMVDTTLFAVRRGKTNKSFFKSVIGQLKIDGIQNIALVFNDVKGREGYYGTSRYHGDKTYYLRKNAYYHDDYFEN